MVYHSETPTMAGRIVLRVLERSSTPLRSNDIAALGDLKISTTRNVLTHLVRTGHVINASSKKSYKTYRIAPAPKVKAEPKPVAPVKAEAAANPETEIIIKVSRADYEALQRLYRAIALEVWADPVLGPLADAGGE